ncbi:plasmid mobilization protein MobA [Escherichia coli]
MMKSDEKYQVPAWMRPLLPLLCNTGGNDPEELLNDTETTASANVVRYVLIVAVRSQVDLLQLLYRKGLLRTEIPGGFSPEEAQALLDNLVRSHISKALSGERMAARDRNADLAPGKEQTMSEKKTRTGSENRKRIVKFTARFTEDEAEIVREKAESSGQTVSTFIRSSSLDKVVNCRTDDRMIDEIMRLGRLQKHLFVEGKRTGDKEYAEVLVAITEYVNALRRDLMGR